MTSNNGTSGIPAYQERPQLPTSYAAVGIILQDGKVLVARRKKESFLGGFWEFPGGKREPGESYAEAVVREVKEETGLVVRTVKEMLPVRFDYEQKRVVLQPYLCEVVSGEAEAIGSDEVKWAAIEELLTIGMPEANAQIIARLISGDY